MNIKDKGSLYQVLFDEYYEFLVQYCFRFVCYNQTYQSYVEDWVQDVFITAIMSGNHFQNHPNQIGWLLIACRNRACNQLKKMRYRQSHAAFSLDETEQSSVEDIESSIERWVEKAENKKHLDEILELLTGDEFTVYKEIIEQGKTTASVSSEIQKPESATKAIVRRIRKKGKKYKSENMEKFLFLIMVSFSVFRN